MKLSTPLGHFDALFKQKTELVQNAYCIPDSLDGEYLHKKKPRNHE